MGNEHFQVKRLEPSEIQEAAETYVRSLVTLVSAILRPEQIRVEDDYRNHFITKIAKETEVWVAARDERLIGVLATKDGWIDQLYVDPAAQRQGVGSVLVAHAKLLCPDGLRVVTLRRNTGACRFYERHGFVAYKSGVSPPPENEPDVWFRWGDPD